MNNLNLAGIITALILGITSCDSSGYDEALARKLGADDYGMHQYVLAMLYTGDVELDSTQTVDLFSGHMDNINRLAESGDLVLAGPFMTGDSLRGLYIFDVKEVSEAEVLTSSDPAIAAGLLRAEFYPWYGSAAVAELNAIHKRIEKVSP